MDDQNKQAPSQEGQAEPQVPADAPAEGTQSETPSQEGGETPAGETGSENQDQQQA